MPENIDEVDETTKLLRVLVRLELDRKLEGVSENEKKKARYLKDAGFSNQEIADLLNKEKSTVSGQLSSLKDIVSFS